MGFCVPATCDATALGAFATVGLLLGCETELIDRALGGVTTVLPVEQLFVFMLPELGDILTIFVFGGNLNSIQLLGSTFKMLLAM